MSKTLLLLRGLPGSGKSTLARKLAPKSNVAADEYFEELAATENISYSDVFSPDLLSAAHDWCLNRTKKLMAEEQSLVVVHNVFSRYEHLNPYLVLADQMGYEVHITVVENHHSSPSVHGVPPGKMKQMRKGWQDILPQELYEWENSRNQGDETPDCQS